MHAQVSPKEVLSDSRDAVGSSNNPVSALARFAANSGGNLASDLFASPVSATGKNISLPKCLLPESVRSGNGVGPVVALDEFRSKLLVVTLGITDVVERTGLSVSVWGSPDQAQWGEKALLNFRQRQYCGVYSALLNLAMYPDIQYMRVQWNMNRWGRGERSPLFGFEVFLEESGARVSSSSVS